MLWLGADLALPFILYTSVIGAALTVGLLQLRRVPLPLVLKKNAWAKRLLDRETGIPYGAAMGPACSFAAAGKPLVLRPSLIDRATVRLRKTRFNP